jgi:hypothetical protein
MREGGSDGKQPGVALILVPAESETIQKLQQPLMIPEP